MQHDGHKQQILIGIPAAQAEELKAKWATLKKTPHQFQPGDLVVCRKGVEMYDTRNPGLGGRRIVYMYLRHLDPLDPHDLVFIEDSVHLSSRQYGRIDCLMGCVMGGAMDAFPTCSQQFEPYDPSQHND